MNRFFDLPHLGFTAAGVPDNGVLATDRPHVFNAMGSYLFNWGSSSQSTNISAFTTFQSGTPQTSFYTLYAAAVLYGRNDMGRTPMYTGTDLKVSHRIRFGGGSKYMSLEMNVLNLFDEANVLGFSNAPHGVDPSIGTLGLPVADEPEALNYVLTNGIVPQFDAYLNSAANPQRKDTAFGLDNWFQSPARSASA